MRMDFALALPNAGKSIAARVAIMAMTTSSSIKVNARRRSALNTLGSESENAGPRKRAA
jgi:hypothetical protein